MIITIKDRFGKIIKTELKTEHKVMCGNCLMESNVEKIMDGDTADILFTSPPYNAGSNEIGGNKNLKEKKYKQYDDNLNQDEYRDFLISFLKICMKFSKYQFINLQQLSGNKIALIEFLYNYRKYFVDTAIWNKGNGQPAIAKNVMNSRFEFIYIFSNKENPKRCIDTADFHGTISNVYEFNPSGKNEYKKEHAAVFPLELPEHFIKHFTKDGMIILDTFGGTGTTLIACEKNNRKCRIIEIDERYTDITIERYIRFKGNNDNVFVLRDGNFKHYDEVCNV